VDAPLQATCRELVELLGADGCTLSRLLGDLLIEVAEYSPSGKRLQLGHGYLVSDFPLTREVLEQRESRTVSVHDDKSEPNEAALLRELGFDSLLMLPLEAAGEAWGLIEIYACGERRFGEEDARLARPVLEVTGSLLAARETA